MPYDGGYYLAQEPLMRTGLHGHSTALDRPISDETLTAINAIQGTAWKINVWAWAVIKAMYDNQIVVDGIPPVHDLPLPAEFDKAEWNALTDEARTQIKKQRSEIWATNAKRVSMRTSFLAKLGIAKEMRDYPAIYFPHSVDFRGRIYPISSDLNPQNDDLAKGLLMFAKGKALGVGGVKWLARRLAANFGLDKLPMAEREAWTWENTPMIQAVAADPIEHHEWWAQAEEPFQFLAGCKEWSDAVAYGDDIGNFVSHLPINVDGTANGLQHLSALGRDPVGAKATNMTSDPKRQDIYEDVASVLRPRVSQDAVMGDMRAVYWSNRISRSVTKRAVMTTPYGVTDRGIRDQLVDDGFVNDVDHKDRSDYAGYLRDRIVDALGQTVLSAREIMAYIQGVAQALANENLPLQWVTPTGNVLQQTYYRLSRRKVSTLCGEITLWDENPKAGLDVKKNTLASAPNVIHSLDASALVKTVNRMLTVDWCMIHDSYGTHACDMDQLDLVLREEFVAMYSGDWLADFEAHIRTYAPDVDLPLRPERGTFELKEVLSAPYFFA